MQKRRQRKRLRAVDNVVDVVSKALESKGMTTKNLQRWQEEMPREEEMFARDKYTIFDRKEKTYRKGIHSESCLHHYNARCGLLIDGRIAEMDSSQPKNQPARILGHAG